MKQMTRSRALLAVVMAASLALTLIGGSAGAVAAHPPTVVAGPKLVLAFYYPGMAPTPLIRAR